MATVVTTFGPNGLQLYANRFMQSFEEYWPLTDKLICYVEEPTTPRRYVELRDINLLYDRRDFIGAHLSERERGLVAQPCWKWNEVRNGYSFRTDAIKFCNKVFAVYDAACRIEKGVLVWMDADTFTFKHVPEKFVERLMGEDDLIYLGRDRGTSECGFIGFRLPQAMRLISMWREFYRSHDVFKLAEWHDSYVFDFVRVREPDLKTRSLTGGEGHVWVHSVLSEYFDHLKGSRKTLGRSPERFPVT